MTKKSCWYKKVKFDKTFTCNTQHEYETMKGPI